MVRSDAGDFARRTSAIAAADAQPRGAGEHDLSVRHWREQHGVQPLRPDRHPIGVKAQAEVPTLARERQKVLVRTGVVADAGKSVLRCPAGEKLVGDSRDHGLPSVILAGEVVIVDRLQSVQMVRHQPKARRRGGRQAPSAPHRPCSLRDRAPRIRPTRARTVAIPLRDGPFRCNVCEALA